MKICIHIEEIKLPFLKQMSHEYLGLAPAVVLMSTTGSCIY